MFTGPFTVDNLTTGSESPNSKRFGWSALLTIFSHWGALQDVGECLEASTRTDDW